MKSLLLLLVTLIAVHAWDGYTCKFETVHTLAAVSPPLKFNAPGLPASLSVSSSNFDVIAFNTFTATYGTGDVEGTLLAKKFNVGAGYSVGWGINGNSNYFLYSLVVDGNATFLSGDVLPPGNDIYIGGAFNAANYLESRRVPTNGQGLPQSGAYGWAPLWTQASSWYNNLASDLAGQTQTVAWNIQYGTLHITGFQGALNHGTYFININLADFNSINAYSFDAPVPTNQAGLTFNIKGPSGYTATFNGGQMPAGVFTYINYNFYLAGTVTVKTGVYGSINAPTALVNQIGGVIWGKVVANNINALQINKAVCTI